MYHSISIILYGDESYTEVIKLASIYVLLEREDFFNNLIKGLKQEIDFNTLVENTCLKNQWGNEINIVALSFLLNRNIICYNVSNKKEINVRVIFGSKKNKPKHEPLLIGLCNNHFFPILIFGEEKISQKVHKDLYFLN